MKALGFGKMKSAMKKSGMTPVMRSTGQKVKKFSIKQFGYGGK